MEVVRCTAISILLEAFCLIAFLFLFSFSQYFHTINKAAHSQDILNVERDYNPAILECVPDFTPIGESVDWSEPKEDDVRWAIMQWKNNKAGDALGLQAEMYKACVNHEKHGETCELVRLMTTPVQKLWRGDEVPASWLDSILLPLYKRKVARNFWNNWRGIVLLNIASKVHAILLNRTLRICRTNLCPKHKSDSDQGMDPLTVYL